MEITKFDFPTINSFVSATRPLCGRYVRIKYIDDHMDQKDEISFLITIHSGPTWADELLWANYHFIIHRQPTELLKRYQKYKEIISVKDIKSIQEATENDLIILKLMTDGELYSNEKG